MGQQQQQWQGEDRRRSQQQYQGEERRKTPGMSTPGDQRDEQQRRAQQLHEDQNRH